MPEARVACVDAPRIQAQSNIGPEHVVRCDARSALGRRRRRERRSRRLSPWADGNAQRRFHLTRAELRRASRSIATIYSTKGTNLLHGAHLCGHLLGAI